MVRVTFDEAKRALTLEHRGLDFRDATQVFEGDVLEVLDDRRDYGEARYQTIGRLGRQVVMVVWTPRDGTRRVISMRRCNAEEKAEYRRRLG